MILLLLRSLSTFIKSVIQFQPDGSQKTVAYKAGVRGYEIVPLETAISMGLAPYPNDLLGEVDKEHLTITAAPGSINSEVRISGKIRKRSIINYSKVQRLIGVLF